MNTVVERSQDKATRPLHQRTWLPWLLLAVLLLLLLVLLPLGYWRSSGVGPQVQVPMFYDAHYLYPRPWTQAQAAPGVPENAPLAFYGANRVSQTFQAGADNLAQIVLRLDGPPGTLVTVVLTDDRGQRWEAITALREGDGSGVYRFTIDPVAGSAGRSFTLSLAAREAGEEAPVLAYSVGGDRLGEAWRLNAFSRPGNLALTTYSRGDVGSWW